MKKEGLPGQLVLNEFEFHFLILAHCNLSIIHLGEGYISIVNYWEFVQYFIFMLETCYQHITYFSLNSIFLRELVILSSDKTSDCILLINNESSTQILQPFSYNPPKITLQAHLRNHQHSRQIKRKLHRKRSNQIRFMQIRAVQAPSEYLLFV